MLEAYAGGFLSQVANALSEIRPESIAQVVKVLERAYEENRTVFIMGNGGSSATASHLACDIRYAEGKQNNLRVLCLTDNVPLLTALGNDLSHAEVFERQIERQVGSGDVVIVLSVSGDSENIVRAVETAKRLGAVTIGFLGSGGGRTRSLLDHHLTMSSGDFPFVESLHCVLAQAVAATFRRSISEAD
jgi:D-sedoheptulose 7-phosphate isomerase